MFRTTHSRPQMTGEKPVSGRLFACRAGSGQLIQRAARGQTAAKVSWPIPVFALQWNQRGNTGHSVKEHVEGYHAGNFRKCNLQG